MLSKKDKKAQQRLDTWQREIEAEIARFADSIRRNPQLMHSRKRRQDRYDKWRQEDEQRMEQQRRQTQDTRDSLSDRETRLLTSLRLLTKYGPHAEAQAQKIAKAMRAHAIKTGAMPATDMPEYVTPSPLPQVAGPVNQEHSSARSSSSDDDDDDETGAGIKHTRSHQSLRSRHRRRMKRPRPNRFATIKKVGRKIKSKKTYTVSYTTSDAADDCVTV